MRGSYAAGGVKVRGGQANKRQNIAADLNITEATMLDLFYNPNVKNDNVLNIT